MSCRMNSAVRIQEVSKTYRLGKIGSRYFFREMQSLYQTLIDRMSGKSGNKQTTNNHLPALDTISLDVSRGETVGIIGRNGSGKSTLLKLLSGITLPSSGTIALHGRVASLLDIGTGFQGDLSARENIFLNGAILGMSRKELLNQFDSIVSFSGVRRFLDTPVKRFSSGMYIRLAFSIAIHCISDILLIDEILSAADRQFLEQCRSKLRGFAANGKTIIIVSHNLKTIRELCPRTLLLAKGKIIADGNTEEVLALYRNSRTQSMG